jgi:hypothetical protein
MVLGLAALVVGEAVGLRPGDAPAPSGAAPSGGLNGRPSDESLLAMRKPPTFASGIAASSAPPPSPLPALPLLAPPDPDTYARQAISNPHQTPAVLRQFAARMAAQMAPALRSEAQANAFFAELRECALKDGNIEAVRASCAVNAGRLAEKFPERLGEGFKQVREKLPREILLSVQSSGF